MRINWSGRGISPATVARLRPTWDLIFGDQLDQIFNRALINQADRIDLIDTEWIVTMWSSTPGAVMAGAVPYLKLAGTVCGAWMMARSADVAAKQLAAGGGDAEFLKAKLITARFYATHILPLVTSFADTVTGSADAVLAMEEAYF